MGSPSKAPGASTGEGVHWSDLPRDEILAELERVLESHHFSASRKCSRFLRHIVEAAIDGRFDSLKERTLGVDVFDREPHYDTNQDPIIRGTAGEVRKRLAQYYLEAPPGKLRITLPSGSYVPEFHAPAQPLQAIAQPLQDSSLVTQAASVLRPAFAPMRPAHRNWFSIRTAALPLCAAIAAALWFWPRPASLERFWEPVFQRNSVFVCIGQPQLYAFHPETARVLNAWFDDPDQHPATAPAPVPLGEIVPMWDKPVALADAQAFSRLVNLFSQKHKRVDLRGERLVSLSDLRGRPVVLIGAYDNDWTLSLDRDLRFYFDTDQGTRAQIIRDRQNPSASNWKLVDAWPPGRTITEDYAIVTRFVNRTTEQTLVIVAGIAQYGTEAAAEFVTEPSYFKQALAHAPRDWSKKNIQVVLSTRVLSGVSGPPTVQATYFW